MKYLKKLWPLLAAGLAFSTQASTSLSNKEIWFGPNTNTPGAGTLSNPYNTTQFWYIMTGMTTGNTSWGVSTNVTVHLLPDTYTMTWPVGYSTPNLPDGIRLIGAGMTNTFIRSTGVTNTGADVHVLATGGDVSSAYISDLTIDCNWQGMSCKKAEALSVSATSSTIERVRCINFGALGLAGATNAYTQECFVLAASTVTNVGGNITIQDCVVEGAYQGGDAGYASCICVWGWPDAASRTNSNVIVRNNTVRNVGKAVGFLYAGENILIEGNHVTGCIQGINSDTGGGDNVSMINNRFDNVGLAIDGGTTGNYTQTVYDGMLIADNFIELSDSLDTNNLATGWASGMYLPTGIRLGGFVQNVLIANNTIEQMPSLRGTTNAGYWLEVASFYAAQPNTNISVVNNSVGPGMNAYFYSAVNNDQAAVAYEAGNHYLDGTVISLFPNLVTALADAATDYTIDTTPASHQLTPAMWIGLATTGSAPAGTRVIHIPDPYYYQGRSFKLYLYKGGTTSSIGAALQADNNGWGGVYNNQVIIDMGTQTKTAVGNPYTVFTATTGAGTKSLTFTSVGGGWMLQR